MPEKYDPLKSAELTTEQNYNMIDGILNNGPAPASCTPGPGFVIPWCGGFCRS